MRICAARPPGDARPVVAVAAAAVVVVGGSSSGRGAASVGAASVGAASVGAASVGARSRGADSSGRLSRGERHHPLSNSPDPGRDSRAGRRIRRSAASGEAPLRVAESPSRINAGLMISLERRFASRINAGLIISFERRLGDCEWRLATRSSSLTAVIASSHE